MRGESKREALIAAGVMVHARSPWDLRRGQQVDVLSMGVYRRGIVVRVMPTVAEVDIDGQVGKYAVQQLRILEVR